MNNPTSEATETTRNSFENPKMAHMAAREIREELRQYPLGTSASVLSMNTGWTMVHTTEILARLSAQGIVKCDTAGVWKNV